MGGKPPSNYSQAFPQINETSFSEQYKTFKALGGRMPPNAMGNALEMSKDLQMRIRPTVANKPYYKRNFKGPNFEQDILGQPGFMSNMPMMGQSVFQTNASHMIASPQTFNMMSDVRTAAEI